MSTIRTLDLRPCATHGLSLHRTARCIHCAAEGIPAPQLPPVDLPAWVRRVVTNIDAIKVNKRPKQIDHPGRPPSKTLTPCEQKVVAAIAAGLTTHGQIAAHTGVNKRSVSRALENAKNRLDADTLAELVQKAAQQQAGGRGE